MAEYDEQAIQSAENTPGIFDELGGLWDSFSDWSSSPKGKQILIGGGSALVANVLRNKGMLGSDAPKVGYQGKIPEYTANRTQIPQSTARRTPGSMGCRYFTDTEFTTPEQGIAAIAPAPAPAPAPVPIDTANPNEVVPVATFAEGGIAQAAKGQYLRGETDGMADEVEATIDGAEPAALSDGEFVIPADVVSHLGNGNSEAGAKMLEEMMSRIRTARTGNEAQGEQIDPNEFLIG